MSFKRDGDDKNALDNQRKRRVAELLYEDIDEEEVIQLSNGKLKCKMCTHQPIFDTLNMFYVHKQGKKHQNSMEYAAQKKQELEELIQKRKHEQLARDGHTVTNQAQEEVGPTEDVKKTCLGIKKPRRPYDRKPVIDFSISPSNKAASSVSIESTSGCQLPGNTFNSFKSTRSPDRSSGNARSGGNTGPDKFAGAKEKPKSFITGDGRHNFKMQCRTMLASRSGGGENSVVHARDVHKLVGQSNAEQNNKYYLSRKKQREETSSLVRNMERGMSDQQTVLPTQTWEFYKDFKGKVPVKLKSVDKPLSQSSADSSEQRKAQRPVIIGAEHLEPVETDCGTGTCMGKKERAEQYLNALGSGWKKDWTGSWVKDDDVEFDSDEEPPDI